jgi:DNA-binding Lrp family transcriptional regulator
MVMAKKWNFFSNYGLVLTHIGQNPQATLREIARGTDLTERAVYQIVRDLELSGVIEKKRVGRRNNYLINHDNLLNAPVYGDLSVAQIAKALQRLMEANSGTKSGTKSGRRKAKAAS